MESGLSVMRIEIAYDEEAAANPIPAKNKYSTEWLNSSVAGIEFQ